MIRFQLATPYFFAPPNPAKTPVPEVVSAKVPGFGDFFRSYFAGRTFNLNAPKAAVWLESLKRCYETDASTAGQRCTHYVNGFRRSALE